MEKWVPSTKGYVGSTLGFGGDFGATRPRVRRFVPGRCREAGPPAESVPWKIGVGIGRPWVPSTTTLGATHHSERRLMPPTQSLAYSKWVPPTHGRLVPGVWCQP